MQEVVPVTVQVVGPFLTGERRLGANFTAGGRRVISRSYIPDSINGRGGGQVIGENQESKKSLPLVEVKQQSISGEDDRVGTPGGSEE
ncbi:uncharacterized protein N7525_004847 [Penicillium rubens]|uniref:uncharacterized protein n=1 Tax=Penicillium rubens TaxID=1108849 RepID=UPI002A5A0939|nr:uncharacterized protein N7525_004847 [Penicillium rubens]KAJ5839659.1 hypothetical protein N7525_004847 [Penicillium rubens]KAJ5867653.1 hypothetical protein N7534_002206 [Penicillium rubens]